MTFFDLHPIDPYEARLKVIATLFLLSELGIIRLEPPRATKTAARERARPASQKRTARAGSRLVRPPRSC